MRVADLTMTKGPKGPKDQRTLDTRAEVTNGKIPQTYGVQLFRTHLLLISNFSDKDTESVGRQTLIPNARKCEERCTALHKSGIPGRSMHAEYPDITKMCMHACVQYRYSSDYPGTQYEINVTYLMLNAAE